MHEEGFIDAVSRNLRLGRLLLLVVGEGIREGVETLAEYLQMHAGFHFTLGIIEMAVFRFPPHGFLVQPRMLARTVTIERGIVRLGDGQVSIEPPPKVDSGQTMSDRELRENLQKFAPQVSAALERFEEEAREFGVFVDATPKSLWIRWRGPDDVDYALGGITPEGELRTMLVNYQPDRIGKVNLAHEYLAKIAALIGKSLRRGENAKGWRVEEDKNKRPKAIDLLSRSSEWLEIIRWYTTELRSAIEAQSG